MDLSNRAADDSHLGRRQARLMFAFAIIFPVLGTLGLAARLYSNHVIKKNYGWDDWTVIGSLISHYVQCIGVFIGIFVGRFGYHAGDLVTVRELVIDIEDIIWLQYPYAFAMAFARASILIFFLRIFIDRWFKWTVYGILSLNAAWFIFVIITTSAQCAPFAYNWNKTIPGGHCINQTKVLLAFAVWGIILDVFIWSLPLPRVWRLQLPLYRKIALSLVFGLGSIDIAVSIIRLVTVVKVDFSDIGYSVEPAALAALAEPAIAVLVACSISSRPVFEKMIPRSWIDGARARRGLAIWKWRSDGQFASSKVRLDNKKDPSAKSATVYAETSRSRSMELTDLPEHGQGTLANVGV